MTNINNGQNSYIFIAFIELVVFPDTSPNKTLFPNHKEYDAARTKVDDANTAYKKFSFDDAIKTMNSPTNPDVPGSPELDNKKNIINAENNGIT